jgi:hypothetical protein
MLRQQLRQDDHFRHNRSFPACHNRKFKPNLQKYDPGKGRYQRTLCAIKTSQNFGGHPDSFATKIAQARFLYFLSARSAATGQSSEEHRNLIGSFPLTIASSGSL